MAGNVVKYASAAGNEQRCRRWQVEKVIVLLEVFRKVRNASRLTGTADSVECAPHDSRSSLPWQDAAASRRRRQVIAYHRLTRRRESVEYAFLAGR